MLRNHNAGVTCETHPSLCFLLGACELIHIAVCDETTAAITLKLKGATTQNPVTHKTRCLAFGHPWDNLLQGTCIHAGSVLVPIARYK